MNTLTNILWTALIALFVFVTVWLIVNQEYITALFLEAIVIVMGYIIIKLEEIHETR